MSESHTFGAHVPLFAVAPFALLLAAIAILPLAAPHFWESHRNKGIVAGLLAAPIALYLGVAYPEGLLHSAREYLSFLALLGSLFVIAGGIHLEGDLEGRPSINTGILAVGALLANVVGTTGASMLLIRTLLRTNTQRRRRAHIPFFFILVVSNCGGLLTPLGDPPLFLGYLRGVPFDWTFGLLPYWALANAYLLALFYVVDRRAYRSEAASDIARDKTQVKPLRVTGLGNAGLLACVVGAVFLDTPWREAAMIALALASVFGPPKGPRLANGFSYGPIIEVAVLFAGIFVTMVPALALLEARGAELGLTAPAHYFFVTGALSSVLDNAPTYLTFLAAAQGLSESRALAVDVVGVPSAFLVAISVGAVFMGANTYIGNGPNFMVKAIAEEAKYEMPSFFGYAGRALLVLSPVYVAIGLSLWLG
ncbi:MAG: sodium:proton antiporter [Sandaracinaceae bacterium]|nr:sodium:proton antiporter [Sandaracinaceae bacterium]